MHRFIFSAIGIFFAVSCSCAQGTPLACQESALPEGVRAALSSQYAEWQIETLRDLNADYLKAWAAKRTNQCPGIAVGHFESKIDLSYALLLISRDKGRAGYKFLVFSRKSSKDAFTPNILEQDDKSASGNSAISRVDPGLEFDEEKFAAFKLKSEGIHLEFFEGSGFIYYWKNGHYERVVESD
jgi:hypothetical protein